MITAIKDKISIPKIEYLKLKKLESRFEDLLAYFDHVRDIREAREEVKQKKTVSQEKLFKRLGIE